MLDSNQRPSGPKPDALPGCANLRTVLVLYDKLYVFVKSYLEPTINSPSINEDEESILYHHRIIFQSPE